MKNKPTLTIGIPAFNEENNIKTLVKSLLSQKYINLSLEKIIVYSDGSTDNTAKIIKGFKSRKVKFIEGRKRMGAWYGQNKIIKNCNSDILVLLDADIFIKDKKFIEKLAKEVIEGKADLTSGNTIPLKPKRFFERVLYVSVLFKKEIFKSFKKGNNVYTCHGQSRAFSKNLYKKFKFEERLGEDAYSYFYCIQNGFKYTFVESAKAYYKLPENWNDHQKQSVRFFKSRLQYKNDQWEKIANANYNIPKSIVTRKFIKYLSKYPIETALYSGTLLILKVKTFFEKEITVRWDISKSSKLIK